MIRQNLYTPAKRFAPAPQDQTDNPSHAPSQFENAHAILDGALENVTLTKTIPSVLFELSELMKQLRHIGYYYNESSVYITDEAHQSRHEFCKQIIGLVNGRYRVKESREESLDAFLLICSVIQALVLEQNDFAYVALPKYNRIRTPSASPLVMKRKQSEPIIGQINQPASLAPDHIIDKGASNFQASPSPLKAWLQSELGNCGCGYMGEGSHKCLGKENERIESRRWKAICELCSSISEALISHILVVGRLSDPRISTCALDPSISPTKEPYLCFLETFAMPLMCYKKLIELRKMDSGFQALDQTLGNLSYHLSMDLHRNVSRPIIKELAEQGMTKRPSLISVHILINLIVEFAIQDLIDLKKRAALISLMNFLNLDQLYCQDQNENQNLKNPLHMYWWKIRQSNVTELDESLYFLDENEQYLFLKENNLRVPECIAIGMTTKKNDVTSPCMKKLCMDLMTKALVKFQNGEESVLDLLQIFVDYFGSSNSFNDLNEIYHKLHTAGDSMKV